MEILANSSWNFRKCKPVIIEFVIRRLSFPLIKYNKEFSGKNQFSQKLKIN